MAHDIISPKRTRPAEATETSAPPTPAVKSPKRRPWALIIVSTLFLVALAAAVLFFIKYQDIKSDPAGATAAQTSSLVAKVGKHMALPDNETPTVATVSDKDKLSNQPFFEKAKNGDKLLIYTNSKQAIIYRDATDKIINVGPIAITDTAGTTPEQ